MYVKMTTPAAAVVRKAPETDPDITGEALRYGFYLFNILLLPEQIVVAEKKDPIMILCIIRAD